MTDSTALFTTYTRDLFANHHPTAALALKDHPRLTVIMDTLSRKENHHVQLIGSSSEKIQLALLESLAHQLSEGQAPKILRDVDFIYFDAKRLALHKEDSQKMTSSFMAFCEELRVLEKRIIFAVNHYHPNDPFSLLLQSMMMNPYWHFIFLSTQPVPHCTTIKVSEPTESQLLLLLKAYKTELESYHHVLIPEDTFTSALSMTAHYLTSASHFDKALELIDSAAARASMVEYNDPTGQFKPLVTSTTLTHVISSWTQIPLTHLHNNNFQAIKFTDALRRQIFGQDPAITAMGSALQHACIKLQEKTGPLCSFLLVGPPEVGKKTAAFAMAEHLFGHKNGLLRIDLSESYHSIAEINIVTEENHSISLLSAIQQTPYAVILIENIHQAPAATLSLFKNIITHGLAFDAQGNKYDFRHAILVITTTLGAERITTLLQTPSAQENNKTLDLMDLVLNDHPQTVGSEMHHLMSPQELCEELMPTLEGYFSTSLLQHLTIIPFISLDYAALEKVIRLKIKLFAKRLESHFSIELHYAPEVIKFLAHEALWRKPQTKPIKKLLEQHLYTAVANEILAHADDRNRPKRLQLQLNDNGQLLRCEAVNSANAMSYNL